MSDIVCVRVGQFAQLMQQQLHKIIAWLALKTHRGGCGIVLEQPPYIRVVDIAREHHRVAGLLSQDVKHLSANKVTGCELQWLSHDRQREEEE